MAKIPTVEELLIEEIKKFSSPLTGEGLQLLVCNVAIEFAKLHVEAALKKASKKSKAKEGQITDYKLTNSILNSYKLDNIY